MVNFGCQDEGGASSMAPDFSLRDLSGRMVSLKRLRGQVVVLDFWATWCPPCRMSIPELVKIQEKYRDKGLTILGISLDDPKMVPDRYIKAFKEKYQINYTILRYSEAVLEEYFGYNSPAIPTLFLIDDKGRLRDKLVGFIPGALEKSLLKLLK